MTALKSILVTVVAVAVVGGALAIAQPRERDGRDAAPRTERKRMHHGRLAAALAKKLGVSAAEVRRAFRETMAENRGDRCRAKHEALAAELGISAEELEKAKDAAGRRGPRALAAELGISLDKLRDAMKAARERRCTELTDSFAAKLGRSGDQVRGAIRELASEKLDAAVKRGRIAAERAARIRERIASSPCFGLPLGHRGFRRDHHRFHRRGFGERFRDGTFEPGRGGRIPA